MAPSAADQPWRCGSTQMQMPQRNGEHHHRTRLMRQPQRQRHLRQQGPDPEHGLRHHRAHSASADVRIRVARAGQQRPHVPGRRGQQHIGQHAVIELHRGRVLEQVHPPGRHDPQPCGHEPPIHQRPGVVAGACLEARDERARHDLQEHQPDQQRRASCDGRAQTASAAAARGPSESAIHSRPAKISDGERQMQRQPVLADVDALGQPRPHHVPADRALQAAEREQPGELRRELARRCARWPGRRGTARGRRRRRSGRESDASTPTRRWS